MTPVDLDLYARAIAAVLKPRRLPRSTMRAVLVQIGTSGADADAIIERALAEGLITETPIFGETYLTAAPLPRA